MSQLSISEAGTVQFPMVRHAAQIGWNPLSPEEAIRKRGGEDATLFRDVLEAKLLQFNPWLSDVATRRQIIERLEALPPTIEGNREMLAWMRGERAWYDETERRHRRVNLIDFEHTEANEFHVTWEWTLKPPARKGNRVDVLFLVNGIPVCLVEHKNPKDGDAVNHATVQLRRYELETPELLTAPQLFNVTHLIEYWYGVTWYAKRRSMARWKEAPDESYRFAVQSFFERTDFLRTLEQWILFYIEDDELKKSVLRQHQRGAIDAIVARCADPDRDRGLIWHTQGSGKTFTLLTAAKTILEQKEQFNNATVIVVVDRVDLEGQLRGWVDALLGEMHQLDISARRAETRAHLQELLDQDFRGLIVTTIHKFEEIRRESCKRDNVFVFIDEAHRSVAHELGSYLMGALPGATIIGFTGTPIAKTTSGQGTFKTFGTDDERGYLHKYSIAESIDDETTLANRHVLAPSELTVPADRLDKEFFELAALEGVTDVSELNRVLEQAVGLRTFLKADQRVANIAKFVAKHFRENIDPLGYKAFLVAVDREACAKYKEALSALLPAGWVESVYTSNASDRIERPLVAKHQLDEKQEANVRALFKKVDELPKILVVTDKLLTGYDAPVLYGMYLDKPMRDHVLLQAIARVNRPYEDSRGVRKQIGLVVDFVGVLRELRKALQFDSADVNGAIESLEELSADLIAKIERARKDYLQVSSSLDSDEQLEAVIYGRFRDPDARKRFIDDYRAIEDLWEINSPSAELRDHILTYKRLTRLYAAVRNAYAPARGYTAELAYKTKRLIEESAEHANLARFSKSVTFDSATIEKLRVDAGPDEGKVFNLVRGLQQEAEEHPEEGAVLQSLKERAEHVLHDMLERNKSANAVLEQLQELAREKEEAQAEALQSGLSARAFGVYWALRRDAGLKTAGVDPMVFAHAAESLLKRYPNAGVNVEEQRLVRAGLYQPVLALPKDERMRVVDLAFASLFPP